MAIVIAPGGWRSIRTTSGIQGGGIEVSNGSPAGSGEGDVCSAGFYATLWSVHFLRSSWDPLPRRFLAQKEIGIVDSEADLVALLADISVAERLESREKE